MAKSSTQPGVATKATVSRSHTPTKTLGNMEQQRAAYAWMCVQNRKKEYTNLAKGAPALIMNNGLMQTLAYYQDKGKGEEKNHHEQLSRHIRQWLGQRLEFNGDDYKNIMQGLFTNDPRFYQRASEESLALLRWIRQFAAAVNAAQGVNEDG